MVLEELITVSFCVGMIFGSILQFIISLLVTKYRMSSIKLLERKRNYFKALGGQMAVIALDSWDGYNDSDWDNMIKKK